MSIQGRRNQQRFDLDANEADPFAWAVSAADREVLGMVGDALAAKRVRLAFQPAVYSADPAIIGFYEGYLRLLDPSGRTIPASDFMAVAETRPLGRELDCAALGLALHAMQKNPGIRVAVNMSARSVGYKPWVQLLRTSLRNRREIGRDLILEINEASAMQMPDVLMPFMAELRAAGIAFTLDDFAAGATSLELLHQYRFEIAKIDGRHIRGIHRSAEHQPIVRAAIALAREFDMFLVAEAVETAEEAEWLRDQGVGCMQGYYFGRPEVAPDFALFRNGRD